MKTFPQIGHEIGQLVARKNEAYGSSFAVSGDFLRLLFPSGIPADRFEDALLLVRIFDKQMRIATDKNAFGESPYQDIAGYGILGVQLHQQKESKAQCPDSASAPSAASQPQEQPASAAQPTRLRTTTSESAKPAPDPSPQPASCSAPSRAATAPTATASANPSEVDQRLAKYGHRGQLPFDWKRRNDLRGCAVCNRPFRPCTFNIVIGESLDTWVYFTCSEDCRQSLKLFTQFPDEVPA